MGVALNDSGTRSTSSGGSFVTSLNLTTLTVSAGSDNCLFALLVLGDGGTPTGVGITWNSTSMTLVDSQVNSRGQNLYIYRLVAPTTGNQTLAASWTGSDDAVLAAINFSGVDQTTPVVTAHTQKPTGSSTAPSATVTSATNDATLTLSGASTNTGTPSFTTPRTQTQVFTDSSQIDNLAEASYALGGTSNAHSFTLTTSLDWAAVGIHIQATQGTSEQEGFRWGVDDGNESAHGWEAAQDTNITILDDQSRLLRVLVNATGDPSSIAYTLRYQKNGSGGYVAVPVGSSATTSPPTAPSATVTTVGTAADPWTINRSTASTGDLVVFVLAWDDSTNTTAVTAPAGVNSETAVSIAGPVASASTEMRMQAWYYVATGAWSSGTLSFDPNATETVRAVSFTIPTGQFNASDPIGWAATTASAGTAESNVNSPTGTTESNDGNGRIYIAFGSDADALTVPGSNWNTINNATGGGVGLLVGSRNTLASNSESVSALTATITSDSWASLAFVVKPNVVNNEVYITTSGNIAAGGEATTARLTAPSGKSTSDFVTGRRWDDENGTDTIDITTDDYTEVEWLVYLAASLNTNDYIEFRVYAGGSALDTYTVTPKWTVGTAQVSASESLAVGLTDSIAGAVVVTLSVADSTQITVTEPSSVIISSVSCSESCSIGSVDTITQLAAVVTALDSVAIALSDSAGSVLASASVIDSTVIAVSDVFTGGQSFSTADTCAVISTELAAIASSVSCSDSVSVGAFETVMQIAAVITAVDSLAVQAADLVRPISVSVVASDSISVIAGDTFSGGQSLAAVDSLPLQLSDALSIFASASLSDSTAIQLSDSGAAFPLSAIEYSVSDSCAVTLIESATVDFSSLIEHTVSDSCQVQLDDLGGVIIFGTVAHSVSDICTVTAVDESLLQCSISGSDLCGIVISEQSAQEEVEIATARSVWDGGTLVEHKRHHIHPTKYAIKEKWWS